MLLDSPQDGGRFLTIEHNKKICMRFNSLEAGKERR